MANELILIVEDNETNLKLARDVLRFHGYRTVEATDGESAITMSLEHLPALILMDIQLPGIDGLELTRRLKADARTREIVIVALTAYAMKGDEDKARAAGCDDYITKPIDTRALPETIARHLANRGQTS